MRIVIALIFVLVCILLVIGVVEARRYRITSKSLHLQKHRRLMTAVFCLSTLGVIILEVIIRMGGISTAGRELFLVHLAFAIPFLALTVVLLFWKTGLHSPNLHRKLGRVCIVAFAGTFVTGIKILFTNP